MTAPAVVAPPPRWLWAYRLRGLRVPEPYRAWVAQDVATDRGFHRLLAWRMLPVVAVVLVVGFVLIARGVPAWPLLGGLVGAVIGSRFNLGYKRGKVLRFQRVDASGQPVSPGGLGRLSNAGAAAVSALVLAGVGALLLALVRQT